MCMSSYRDTDEIKYCAIERELDPKALSDNTVCEYQIIMRLDSYIGEPTCSDCRKVLGFQCLETT